VSETTHEAVARRLGGHLAERPMTHIELAHLVGWDRGAAYRRFAGLTPLNVNELRAVSEILRLDVNWLLTGGPHDEPTTADGAYSQASEATLSYWGIRPEGVEASQVPARVQHEYGERYADYRRT
jgi:hypothetical protein